MYDPFLFLIFDFFVIALIYHYVSTKKPKD